MSLLSGFVHGMGERAKAHSKEIREEEKDKRAEERQLRLFKQQQEIVDKLTRARSKEDRAFREGEAQKGRDATSALARQRREWENEDTLAVEKRKVEKQTEARKRIALTHDIDPESTAAYQLAGMTSEQQVQHKYDKDTGSLIKVKVNKKVKKASPYFNEETGEAGTWLLYEDGTTDIKLEHPMPAEEGDLTDTERNRAAQIKRYRERYDWTEAQAQAHYDRVKSAKVSPTTGGVVFTEEEALVGAPSASEIRAEKEESKRQLPSYSMKEATSLTNTYYEETAPYIVDNEVGYKTALADTARTLASEHKMTMQEALPLAEQMLLPQLTEEIKAEGKPFFGGYAGGAVEYSSDKIITYNDILKVKKKYPNATIQQIISKYKEKMGY